MNKPIWDKGTTDAEEWVTRFTVGDDYRWDRVLLPYDVRATRAHGWGLHEIGILSDDEWAKAQDALDLLLDAYRDGEVTVSPSDEDSHTVIEQFVTEHAGDVGRKIHTGRSRNDQVLAALRLYLRDELVGVARQVAKLSEGLCGVADRHGGIVMPGYTHLQRAMPSTVPLWALGYAETLADDLETLRHARQTINVSPLGSAAGYGVPELELPRKAVAERLGFEGMQTHATAVQLARGKHELAVAHACTQIGASCNRLASDLVLFATSEFDFVDLPDEHCTGSSIMPQKKNPDVLELVRAYHHRLAAEMQSLATGPSNLPGGYHRDLQLTKGAVLRSVQIVRDVLSALQEVVQEVTFRRQRTEAACTSDLLATARALQQVQNGVPFRTAYRETPVGDTNGASVDPEAILGTYVTEGGPGQERADIVREQLRTHECWIGSD